MKPRNQLLESFSKPLAHPRGFALIVTLSLMILLTVIAVGLLSLSSISLRAATQGDAMAAARANARMSLMLAIGDLQRQLGPDTRISATADQVAAAGSPAVSTTPQAQRHWTGAYKAWPTGLPADARPAPEFLQWFVSGDPARTTSKAFAATLNPDPKTHVEIVSANSVGTTGDPVRVPMISQTVTGGKNNFAWWASDDGVKAYVPSDPSPVANGTSDQRLALQAAPHYGLAVMTAGASQPFAAIDQEAATNRKLITWQQAGFAASSPKNVQPLFHDLTTQNRGLLINVRDGGFRRDLSMKLQAPESAVPKDVLYTAGGRDGINFAELWAYHNLWSQLRTGLGGTYTSGGAVPPSASYLQPQSSQNAFSTDKFHFHKQPAFIRFQSVVSFASIPTLNTATGVTTYKLGLVVDPIVTLWNPLDVTLSLVGSWNSVKYWPLPYDIVVVVNGVEHRVPYRFIVGTTGVPQNLTMRTGTDTLKLKPGEVMVFSQGSNTPTTYNTGSLQTINGKPGWNFGGGMYYEFRNNEIAAPQPLVTGQGDTTFTFRVEPNNRPAVAGTNQWALSTHGVYYKEDRAHGGLRPTPDNSPQGSDETINTGAYTIDSLTGQPYDAGPQKPTNKRILASDPQYKSFFDRIANDATVRLDEINTTSGNKLPFMVFSFSVKTEGGSENPGRFLARYNPRATTMDFHDLSQEELRVLPFEIQIQSPSGRSDPLLGNSQGYFGGGWTIEDGSRTVITHSVPRQPPVSLAAFQHSMANGFVTASNGRVDNRRSLLPQVSHAIGNSLASSALAPEATTGSLDGPRPLADHSYLANLALWDNWFLSGISPQTSGAFASTRAHKIVAQDFLNSTKPLPVKFYKPALLGNKPEAVLAKWFNGNAISTTADTLTAAYISVEGMFNVNSTSVEAWKALLSALRNREILGQNASGANASISNTATTPVSSLQNPREFKTDQASLADRIDPAQWSGVRILTDVEIEALAKAIVSEVRKRGPFLNLADFVNRRVGTDKSLALSGAVQSALDSDSVPINEPFRKGDRTSTGSETGLAFPEAERGAAAYGIPGYVKQADILTPIAPLLSARSDTFTIRGYGERLDASGRIIARAWCEAVVQRGAGYVNSADEATKLPAQLSAINQTFGRRFEIVSFRWLNPAEA